MDALSDGAALGRVTLNQNLSRCHVTHPPNTEPQAATRQLWWTKPGIGLRSVDGSNIAENSQGIRAV